jgi:hypothetical protein
MRWLASLVLAVGFWASSASAHDLGVSRSTLTERQDGSIHGQFTFAAREGAAALDPAGHVAIEIRTDGARCTPTLPTATLESDGLVFDEDFACTRATTSIEATVAFVGQMGSAHEHVATLEAWGDNGAVTSELLRGEHRTIALTLHRPRPKTPRMVLVALALGGALVLVVAIRSILRR